MYIRLPRVSESIDLDNVPENFDELIKNAFEKYTHGTSKEYMFEDKLSYIDICIESLNSYKDSETEVDNLVIDEMKYEWYNNADVIDRDEIFNYDFMVKCFDRGLEYAKLDQKYNNNKDINKKIKKLLLRIIKVVVDYE